MGITKTKRCSSCKHCVLKKTDITVIKTSSGARFDTGWVHICDTCNMRIKSSDLDDIRFCKRYESKDGSEERKRKSGRTSPTIRKGYKI